MIACAGHGKVLGYVVCVHVLAGEPCVEFVPATDVADEVDSLGEALCASCAERLENVDQLKLVCERCLAKYPYVNHAALPAASSLPRH